MRKLVALTGACVALGLVAVAADAGPATVDANGNYLVLDADVSPPIAGSRARLALHGFAGNRRGQDPPRLTNMAFRLPSGWRYNGALFAKCRLPRTQQERGTDRCSRASKIGSGTAQANAPSFGIHDPVPVSLSLHNGEFRNGRPTVVILARASVNGTTVTSELDFEFVGGSLRLIPPPSGSSARAAQSSIGAACEAVLQEQQAAIQEPRCVFTLLQFDLVAGKTIAVRRDGARVRIGLFETPTRCRGSWQFSQTNTLEGGRTMTARDRAPCVKR